MVLIVGGDHGQGVFRFPINVLFLINGGETHVQICNTAYILYLKDNGIILNKTIMKKNHDSFYLMLLPMTFDN